MTKHGQSKKGRGSLSFSLLYVLPVLTASAPVFAQAAAPQDAANAAEVTPGSAKASKKYVTRSKAKAATNSAPAKASVAPAAPAAPAATAPISASKTSAARTTVSNARLAAAESNKPESVTVIGSLFKDPNLKSMSPITHISRQDMQRRGFANVTDTLQSLSSNGAGTLANSFSANGAFAGGASAPSLRGLSTDSTLVLMDGMRLSYYPLSDDGERNFVDTNWMPSSIMESVDTMEDAGSSRISHT
ncbi:hypothetical protein AD952_07965 [Acetobacter cerevisiae]|uniref:TonB-dependent receptor plug domain-containing protein n=1 Tax=Acetobacter cerevisiae TaxID=178900 RepID=A0A149UUK5_9PROT|nr:hypothetical protein AD952_07965 [Acetobacter cerevisiae]